MRVLDELLEIFIKIHDGVLRKNTHKNTFGRFVQVILSKNSKNTLLLEFLEITKWLKLQVVITCATILVITIQNEFKILKFFS